MYTVGIDEDLKLKVLERAVSAGFKSKDLPAYIRAVLRNYCNDEEHAEALQTGTVEFDI